MRISRWWNYLVPFLLGIGFCAIYIYEIPFSLAIQILGLLFITITGTIAFGYFINDWTDIVTDKIAGKHNFASTNSLSKNVLILIGVLIIALLPWSFLPVNIINFPLYLFQLFLLSAYSVFPLRLKRFPLPGVVLDALYNSVIPFGIILTTFIDFNLMQYSHLNVFLIIFVASWAFLKGLRGILLHQVQDRKNDRKTSVTTFANKFGPLKTVNLVSRYLLKTEVILLLALILILSIHTIRFLWLVIPLFLTHLFFRFRLWERLQARKRELKFSFLFVLNDFYEEWLPLVFLFYLINRDYTFLILLLLHILLFYAVILKMIKKTKKDLQNSRDFLYYLGEYLLLKIFRSRVNET